MAIRRVKYKLIAVVGVSLAIVLFSFAYYFTVLEERAILGQNERTVHRLTESVIEGLHSVMLAGYAHIAQSYAEQLETIHDVKDFRILRADGTEAYRDDRAIESVDRRRGEALFVPKEAEERREVFPADDLHLARVAAGDGSVLASYYEFDERGQRYLTFLDAISNLPVLLHACATAPRASNPARLLELGKRAQDSSSRGLRTCRMPGIPPVISQTHRKPTLRRPIGQRTAAAGASRVDGTTHWSRGL